MRNIFLCVLLFMGYIAAAQQPLIHSHNDYEKPEPLFNALRNKAFTIEADVYPGDSLFVAHDKKDIRAGRTLVNMYLQPIVQLFNSYHGRISGDADYAPILMIDIKENSELVIPALVKLLAPYRDVFDRSINPHAVLIVLSGERGHNAQWTQWPAYIFFDGRPYERYDNAILKRVAFISDSYMNYISPKDSIDIKLKQLVAATHNKGKLLRLWAIPDNEAYWRKFHEMGIDIINTDKVAGCSRYFSAAVTR
ncbi:glycerophosphodiester phosphodiesterase [Panacibacter ginsenosidivorans]|uniref:Altered inheritance of mitochondria protein 6 n=1 Tax=Panacibacter ginsenosidivorans TaxID=1813871 RepID=A0A5B8V9C0_9BACT|nr:glycerophosphodiester phosphodiesterase [Panacibacter ginsenosidivorans]QEC67839.1 glycerophosphodiester phosphodiesterase [Panacibacter ginsenosidivorans]